MSLQASQAGIKLAKIALAGMQLNQQGLAARLDVERQQISKFFNGKSIGDVSFVKICETLKLDWQTIVEQAPSTSQNLDNTLEVDTIVQTIRKQIKPIVHQKCGTMRVLDMEQPIELTGGRGIYTKVNILERITGRNRLEIAEILQNCGVEEFDRAGLSRVTEKRVPGLEAVEQHRKLMVLGKPGAGKSTFLKYLAMQCIEGNFQANRIPIFITLKDFAEIEGNPDLFTYINQLIGLPTSDTLRKILQQGQTLMLLDGLDEVREEDTKRVLKQILEFSDQFHLNQFVMTCRIAAKEYTFERFTEVEVADFDQEQIAIFSQNWFRLGDPTKAKRFIQKLEENEPIQELASSPLLLTLLCLVFGESADFPANRSELYKEGLDILLKKWDGKRNIEREQLYKNLSLKRKEDLLSQIALTTFEQKDYFFKQKMLEAYISDFIRNLPNVDSDPEILRIDSEAVLKSIEAQHGLFVARAKSIYSFSHLTFHEYFAAKEIVANSAYKNLVQHLTEKRWREVFLLTASMMRNADDLLKLMKQNIDELPAADEKLQQFLSWVHQKSSSVEVPYKPMAVRAFYFSLALALALDRDLALALARARDLDLDLDLARDLDLALDRDLDLELKLKLQEVKDQLPNVSPDNRENRERWWQENGQAWTEQLRAVMIEYRNIGHDWQFSEEQKQLLQDYYYVNKLLIDCLNSDCYVSRDVRQEIEDTLLLPMSKKVRG
jgi:predicted NACHT family NTPase